MKKANVFVKTARNPEVVRYFIGLAKKKRTRCFIATSAFQTPNSLEVHYLRVYRDHTLKNSYWGRKFVFVYYKISPTLAQILDHHSWLKPYVRSVLRAIIKSI